MSNLHPTPRVAIIGAGPGGLASAMLLAREGVPVTVFEREPAVGGRTRTIRAPGGYAFDIGPTFFLYPRILKDIFEACGERLEDHVDLKRLDPQYHLVFEGGGAIRATSDLPRLEQEIARIAPADARNVRRFFDDNRAKLEAFRPVLEQAFSSPADLVSPAMLAALPKLRPFSSVDSDLRRYFSDPRVRLAFSFQTKYLGIEGDVGDLAHHTIFLARDYERNIQEITGGILSEEPSIYVQHAGATDPTLAPEGHTSLYVLVPVPNLRSGIDWAREAPRYRKLALDRLKLLGIADIESRIRFERVVTPRGWQDEFSVFEGATFNLAHNLTQMLYFRPHNRFGRNVYLVGGGTHPGSGLPVIFEGARITTRLLLEDRARRPAGRNEPKPAAETVGEAAL